MSNIEETGDIDISWFIKKQRWNKDNRKIKKGLQSVCICAMKTEENLKYKIR